MCLRHAFICVSSSFRAVTPALYGIKQDVPYELLKILPSMALLLVAPMFPAMVATLLPAPSLAIFRAKRQLKYMMRCTEAVLQCFSIGFANQDASVSDIRQILEQLDTSIAVCVSAMSCVRFACPAESLT